MPSPLKGGKVYKMKRNTTGKYLQEEGSVYAEDIESKGKIIYFVNQEQRVVIRSVFEEDVYNLAPLQKMNNREKNWLIKKFAEPESIEKYFVIEDLENFQADGTRKILGVFNILEQGKGREEEGEACIYVKRNVDPRLAELLRNRVAITLDEFCYALGREIMIEIYRPSK